MKSNNTDKNLSGALLFLTLGFILYAIGSDGGFIVNDPKSLKDILGYIFEFYLDFIIIAYVFICLQIAGYLELKHRQDYLTISVVSILLTPFSIFFIYKKQDDD